MHKTLIEMVVGFGAGLAVAIGGAIKDSPYEGFDIVKFLRSPLIGALQAPVMGKVFKHPHPALIFLTTIGTERITTESYKLLRAQMPSKFLGGEWGIPKRILKSADNDVAIF